MVPFLLQSLTEVINTGKYFNMHYFRLSDNFHKELSYMYLDLTLTTQYFCTVIITACLDIFLQQRHVFMLPGHGVNGIKKQNLTR